MFDIDNNGFISTSELEYVLLNLGEKFTSGEVNDMISDCDPGRVGFITLEVFMKVLSSLSAGENP